ncbi:MAG: hypothetical protein IT373_37275 [Polyangiaceae bacterium]|nr:hypothetical protein [Polyangiaceae bacterium]
MASGARPRREHGRTAAARRAAVVLAALAAVAGPACTFPDVTIADACQTDEQCPKGATVCLSRACADHACVLAPAPARTSCGAGLVCDGAGACVACVDTSDCTGSETCEAGACVATHCHDDVTGPGETGVDCGDECAPCVDGQACALATDCASGFCQATTSSCRPCASAADCAPDGYCETTGRCTPTKPDGVTCTSDDQCDNGHCPAQDHVCCEIACDGACISCDGGKSGGSTGQCQFIPAGADPDEECVLACGGSGACQLL